MQRMRQQVNMTDARVHYLKWFTHGGIVDLVSLMS